MSLYSYTLPVEEHQQNILSAIEKSRVTIIRGPTGCGKSTFIPYLFRDKKVAIIEPRRIAVTSLYRTLSEKIPNLGYRMRFSKKTTPDTTMTIFTDGAFLNNILDLEYDYIIVDEVHERSVRTDMILSILKATYRNKLILMSATIDTEKLRRYFKAGVYDIPGTGHPVDIKYLDKPTSDYIIEAHLIIKKILREKSGEKKEDILVFLPGVEDIGDLYKLCRRIPCISICRVHSMMTDQDQLKIYDESERTRVILATNICETSITIPNVKYVIDTGLFKNKVFDGISHLGIQPISRDSAVQRMGRCNRLGPGICYRLYIAGQRLSSYQPEIMRCDLSSVLLFIISIKKNIFTFEFIDYPTVKNVKQGLEFLLDKCCITQHDTEDSRVDDAATYRKCHFRITNYGRRLLKFPFDVHLAHFYEQAISANVGYYGAVVVAMISQENYNFLNAQGQKISDIRYLVDLFDGYISTEEKSEFCVKRGIPPRGMETAQRILKSLGMKKDGDVETLERVFSRCFSHNSCTIQENGSYMLHRLEQTIYIHPSSGYFKQKCKNIVVVDVFCTTKTYARIVGKRFS